MPFDWQAELDAPPAPTLSSSTVAPPPPKPLNRISFAQALTTEPRTSSNDNLPKPLIRGEKVSITITQHIYEKGMEICKHNLRGRLVLNKGDKPYTTKDIHLKLQKQWKTTGEWSIVPLGRGYFEFKFSTDKDLRMVWASGTVNLKPGVLRLFEWTKDFNMHRQKNTHAQVWIRLLELPQEYWMDRTLREIASVVGTPLIIDNATSKRLYGHYASILVDIDFSRQIFHEITVAREGYEFDVEVAYKWMPDFCSHCQNLGHDGSACRWLYPRKDNNANKEIIAQGKKHVPVKKHTWVPTKENPSSIGSSLAFTRPQQEVGTVPPVVQQQIEPPLQRTDMAATKEVTHSEVADVQQEIATSSVPVESDLNEQQGTDIIDDTLVEEIILQHENTTSRTSPVPTPTVNRSIHLSQNSFSMPLINVSDEVARIDLAFQEPILSPVQALDVSKIAAAPDATVDPTLRKEMDFMQNWLDKAAVNEDVPFTEVLTKS